jgi:hypothetical protein
MVEDMAARWLAGEPIDPAVFATLTNSERRLYETCGLRRTPRDVTPSLREYLQDKAAPAEPAAGTTEETQ